MKGSHVNRPTEVFENTKESMLKKLREWQIWAETQEKELREIIKSDCSNLEAKWLIIDGEAYIKIKEILG